MIVSGVQQSDPFIHIHVAMYTLDEYTSLHDDFNQKFNNINNHGMSGDLCLLLFLKGQPCGGVR